MRSLVVTYVHVTGMGTTPKTAEDWDDLFRAFVSRRRRRLFLALWGRGPDAGPVPLDDLPASDAEDDRLKLRHVHLPMLDEMGYVAWDPDRNEVGRGPRFGEAVPLVEWFRERDSL